MISLASQLNNSAWVEQNIKFDEGRLRIKNFYLPGKLVSHLRCVAAKCVIKEAENLDKSFHREKIPASEHHPMCWCYSCNLPYHLKCQAFTPEAFVKIIAPFVCNECKSNALHHSAVNYFQNNGWREGVKKRRARFFEETAIKNDPSIVENQNTDDEFDEEDMRSFVAIDIRVDDSFEASTEEKLEAQIVEMKKMSESYHSLQAHFDRIEAELTAAKATIAQQQRIINPNVPTGNSTMKEKSCLQVVTAASLLCSKYLGNENLNKTRKTVQFQDTATPLTSSSSEQNDGTHPDMTLTERVLVENTTAQRQVSLAMTLDMRRKALPKMTKFKGDAKNWIKFQKEVQRYRDSGCYDDDTVKFYILGALEGVALRRVQDMIDVSSLDEILKILETKFGHSPSIIKACEDDLFQIKVKGELMRNDVVFINSLIQTYFTSCRYAKVNTLNSNILATHVLNQLSGVHKLFFQHHYAKVRPNDATQIPDLDVLFSFFEGIASDLEVRADEKDSEKRQKTAQVNVLASTSGMYEPTHRSNDSHGTQKSKDNFKYEIKDKNIAQYIGYDLNLVSAIPKKCLCCGKSGHYTLECYNFKSMPSKQKSEFVSAKNICRNCLLTSEHKNTQCALKLGCGFKTGTNRCSQKHHIVLHDSTNNGSYQTSNNRSSNPRNYRASARRTNTNHNTRRANEVINNNNTNDPSRNSSQSHVSSSPPQPANVNFSGSNGISSSPLNYTVAPRQTFGIFQNDRTVKVFKHFMLGPHIETIGYSIGDSGAEITLIREDLRQMLKIPGVPSIINLQWADGTTKVTNAMKITLELKGLSPDSEIIKLENCFAVTELNLPSRTLDVAKLKRQFPYLESVQFDSYENAMPALLIGSPHAACFEAIEPVIEAGAGKPIAIKSKLGWSIYGGEPENYPETPYVVQNIAVNESSNEVEKTTTITNDELNELLTNISSIENLGIRPPSQHFIDDEKKAIKILDEQTIILPNGSVEVPLVWDRIDGNIPNIPNNYPMVVKRQLSQEIKLSKNDDQRRAFNENFHELLKEGYVRPATVRDLNTNWQNVWYLPMSLVVNENKIPVKYRNVYDASARYQGTSLNDKLLMGPNLLIDILQPLFKMRMNKIAFTCDVKSMFHRIFISERDQQCQRILWRENESKPWQTFIQQVMLFGPKSSPFTSQYVKNITADKWDEKYPEAAKTLKKFTYMDDVLTSAPTVQAASEIALQCIEILKSINWDLVSFQSNCIDFMRTLPHTHIKQELIPILSGETESKITKVLGCAWDPKSDCFVFQLNKNAFVRIVKECGHRPTKRDQCSTIARIFDALGLIAHFVIRGRILLQRSWREHIDWDDEISEEAHLNWNKWLDEIDKIAQLKIPRRYSKANDFTKIERLELHVFCDAGKEAFAAVAFWVDLVFGFRHSSLVMAKAKVTPIKQANKTEIHEIPRVELLSCLIAARLADTITKSHPEIKFERFFWSDSEVALRWIKNPNQKLIKFAISPVDEILEKTKREEWRYVPSQLNTADIATKFQKFDFGDINSEWFKGPKFIRQPLECWPEQKDFVTIASSANEYGSSLIANVQIKKPSFQSPYALPKYDCKIFGDILISRLDSHFASDWTRLTRVVARALKIYDAFITLIKNKSFNNAQAIQNVRKQFDFIELEPSDYERAELFIIRKMQREYYSKEFKALERGQFVSEVDLNPLYVFLDDQKVMRLSSRVQGPSYAAKNAPVVPRKHPLTRILVFQFHEDFQHAQIEAQVAALRSYCWMPQVRKAVMAAKGHCNRCAYFDAHPVAPIMAALPECRTDPDANPFEVTGVDCTGALTYYNHNRPYKAYVLLFTCTKTRLIHVHLLDALDTLSMLEAIVQFWTPHGPVSRFISDNGTNFVGAAKRLKKDQENIPALLFQQRNALQQRLAEKYRLQWQFLPPYSPWFGGFYERLIKEVKNAIELTIKSKKLSRKELNIAIQDAAHRINLRPLTHNPLHADDEEVLTPHHLAKNRSGWPLLPSRVKAEYDSSDKDDRLIYHRGRAVADEIMRRFTSQYLPTLTKRGKWFKEQEDLKIGDLVLIIDPNNTRSPHPRARIIETHEGRDGHVRVVDLVMPDGSKRNRYSAQRVAKLEIKRLEDDL